MAELVYVDPLPRRSLSRAHRALEAELRALLSREKAAEILDAALEKVVMEDGEDPARRLRAIVGARLLDEVADLLGRVGETIRSDETPTLTVPIDPPPEPIRMAPADERARRRSLTSTWSTDRALARRTG